ncbi:CorA family divalent cation transporter, partial [Nguyenibacter vanlangensis]
MFLAHPPGEPARTVTDAADFAGAAWLDLIDPTPEEQALAARLTGQRIPTREALEEIESSSRLFMEDDAVYLSTPLIRRTPDDFFVSPVGFVLMRDRLLTIRFTAFSAFETVARQIEDQKRADGHEAPTSDEIAIRLMEAVVDRLADILEHLGQALDVLSRDIFQAGGPQRGAGQL